jgi:AcrR family transcriptional regulator
MARWEPNAQERLITAALELFAEQGYEATTVNEIAERAGLTKTTFFRHFPDKREVLFVGQGLHGRLIAEGMAAAPDSATPLAAIAAGMDAVAETFTADRHEFAVRLMTVMAANKELQERAAFKRLSLAEAMTDALHERGVAEPTASLAAELGTRAFYRGFELWAGPDNRRPLAELCREVLEELRAAGAALT